MSLIRHGRNTRLSFVCALLLTLGGGLSVLTPVHTAYASASSISAPDAVLDAPPSHDATTGTLAGQAGTDGGASSYRIPIVVPPGRAGMQPSLSLSYNSRGGDGVAGLGWSISGLSSVHRCPQTPEQDGATRGVSYTLNDRLCLDGQRLVSVSGGYGASGTTYKTEIDSYARITQLGGSLTSSTTSFQVEQKDGRILRYGTSSNSRVLPNGAAAPLSWLVDKIEDRVGNYQSFSYFDPTLYSSVHYGELLLDTVTYTGSAVGGVGNRAVKFSYQSRPSAASGVTDIASSALAGGLTMQTMALKSIRTMIDGATVRAYKPHYEKAKYSGRLLMTSLEECFGDTTTCHPATQFSYNDGDLNFQLKSLQGLGLPSTLPGSGEENEDYHIRLAGDYDGDGTRETVVSAKVGTVTQVYLAQFTPDRSAHVSTMLTAPYNQVASEQITDADMDGSGRSALIGLQLDPTNVAFGLWNYALFPRGTPATSNPFGIVRTNILLPESFGAAKSQSKLVLAADVDGNGKTDILTIHPDPTCGSDNFGSKDAVFLHKNNIDSPFVISQTVTFDAPVQLFCLERIVTGSTYAEATIDHIADFNGDGLADFYLRYAGASESYVGGIAGIRVTQPGAATAQLKTCAQIGLVSDGTATDDCSGNQNYAVRWMDVNADGLEDFVIARPADAPKGQPLEGRWKLRLNLGNGTFGAQIDTGRSYGLARDATGALGAPYRFRYANSLPAMDVDSDGKADLLIPSQKPGAQAFALKMCTIKRVPKIAPADGGATCPFAVGQQAGSSAESPDTGEVCAAYSCPPNPDGSQTLPDNESGSGENFGYPYQWNDLPAFDAYSKHTNHRGPGEDNSTYHLAQLKFIQTGPASFDVAVVETPLVSRLSDYYGRADDLFGDGLPDLITSIGCSNLEIVNSVLGDPSYWKHQKCSVVNDPAYGPTTLPDGSATSTFANKVVLYANVNQGLAASGGSQGAASIPASQRPLAPILVSSGPGLSLSLPMPNLPGLMDSTINGVGDFATWGYFPLSVRAIRDQLPLYTLRTDGDPNGYTDKRHYYFQSSMPVVYGMSQNTGDGSVKGARSAFYGYTEAMYNHLGRGFQGFRSIVSNNVAPSNQSWRQLRTTTTFHQKFPLTGRIERVETRIPGTGRLIKLETDSWICDANRGTCPQGDALGNPVVNANGGTVYAPLLDTQRVDNFDLGTGLAVSHSTTVNAAAASGGTSGWDSNGNLLTQFVSSADDGAGGSFVSEHRVTTTNTYVPADNVPVTAGSWWLDRLSSSHVVTSLSFDSNRKLPNGDATAPTRTVDTSYVWNSPDRTPQSQTVTASGKSLVTTYSYISTTAKGLPSSVTISGTDISPSRATQFTYTKDGSQVAGAQDGYFVLTTTNAAGQSSTTQHSARDGQVTVQTDPNNLKSISSYDGFGRLTGMNFKDANNQTLLPDVSIGYSRCGGGISSFCGSGYGEGDNQSYAAWRVTRVQAGSPTAVDWFDVLGRTIKHVERGFGGDFVETTTDFDAMGTTAFQSTPFYQGSVPDLTAWSYDALGRPTLKNAPGAELDPTNGNILTTYSYNGSKTTIKVRGVNVSATCSSSTNLCMDMSRSYDVLGRLEQTVQGNGASSNYAATNYWYDGLGNPIAAQDAGGSVLSATYNDLGQRTDLFDPDAGHWQFTYDALGEVIDQTDARGVVTNHVYDVLGRLTQRTATNNGASDASLKVIQDTWVYDPPGAAGGAGLLDYAARQKGSSTLLLAQIWKESNSYESSTKRLSSQTTTLDGQASPWQTSYTYDSFGRPFTTGYQSGLMVRKDYTSYGDLNQLSNYGTGQVYWTGSAKDAWGNLTDETYLGTIIGSHASYASTGQSRQKKWTTGGALLNQLDYSYDSFGNIKSQASALEGVNASETYVYDGLQRLTNASRSGVAGAPAPVSYRYFPNGNLSAKSDYSFGTQGSYVYAGGSCGPHAVTAVARSGGSLSYTCDANGNVIGGNTLTATYDFNNQPWMVSRVGAGTAQFAYSANGDVFRTLTSSANTWFGPAGYEESQTLDGITQRHELGPVVVLRQNGEDTTKAVLRDRLGSQVMMLDVAGGGGGGTLTAPILSATPNPSYDGNYTLTWTNVPAATEYQLFEAGLIRGEVLVYQGPAKQWSPPTAKTPRRYAYRVKACNSTCSDFSQTVNEDVVPLPPSTVTASQNPSTTGNFRVSWSVASGANNYVVEEKGPGATSFQAVASGVTGTFWDAVARANGIWQYRVKSCLSSGACGNPSAPPLSETVNSTGGGLQPPGWITSNDPNSTDGTYTVNWEGSKVATYWKLEEFMNGDWVRYAAVLTSPSLQIYIRPTGDYRYRALACDGSGCSAPSVEFVEHVNSSNPPYNPSGLTVDPPQSRDGNYTVLWDFSPGSNVTYRLEESSPALPSWHEVANQTTTSKYFPGQAEGDYQYRVKACNLTLCSGTGTPVYAQVWLAPDAPVFTTPAPAVGGQLALNWSAPATTTKYNLEERLNGGAWRAIFSDNESLPWLTNSAALKRGDGAYEYHVQACSVHCSAWSNVVSTTVTSSPFATMPASIASSVAQGDCVPFNTANPPNPPNSYYTISWPSSHAAQTYVVRETNSEIGPPVEVGISAVSRQFSHRWNELPGVPRPDSTTFTYDVKACTGSGECSPWIGTASTCLAHGIGPNSPESAPTTTAYDAFGKVRNGDYSDRAGGLLNLLPDTLRGFTGHQHVDDVRLIHMNGRIYDYELGRFLSVDPVIQFPTNTQSMNPYSYIMNNPLSGADPTGYAVCSEDDEASCLLQDGGVNTVVNKAGDTIATTVVADKGQNLTVTGNGASIRATFTGKMGDISRVLAGGPPSDIGAISQRTNGTLDGTSAWNALGPDKSPGSTFDFMAADQEAQRNADFEDYRAHTFANEGLERPMDEVLKTLVPPIAGASAAVETYQDIQQHGLTAATIGAAVLTVVTSRIPGGRVSKGVGKSLREGEDIALRALPKPPTGPGSVLKSDRDPTRFFSPSEREAKRVAQGHTCRAGCGTRIDSSNSRGHHIKRHADGGRTVPENHAEVCVDCHKELHSGD
jgi:RHS repeat-associated protein